MQTIKNILPLFIKEPIEEYQRRKYCANKYKGEELKQPGTYYSLNAFDFYKCIFIHVPKAAGVSINKTLFGNLAGGHYTVKDYQNIYKPSTLKKYFKFTIVRNPYDRLFSAYTFLKKGGFNKKDAEWVNNNLRDIHSYEQFVKEWLTTEHAYTKNHFTPQYEYLINNNGDIGVDFIGKLETIDEDFLTICNKIGVKRELVHANKTGPREKVVLDTEMKKMIQEVYAKDFELLNYSYDY
ncbi:sulfotransferase family 2 domain-containing protein [Saccharicrinis fermentans]|uniref:Sulfotransferase family protein n=1 Tax=Saccharicrinis fermentans DSM 9555 = JCM 21142 TaxID=869213 RepID=W7Y237_9BACT|nr:sulfotransferase family 2 domain-containing protein [Saccharicrinis fermentans]GAF04945.1 sulfotransferase family protein [Saccharicrinis fermentans DSM 9555 = JCM 21142]